MSAYHQAVLLHDCIQALHIRPQGVYVDLTFGGGGHSRAILEQLSSGTLLVFDKDADAQANFEELASTSLVRDNRFLFADADFRHLKRFLRLHGITTVDGILADLGVSSYQLDEAEKGFSLRFDGPLDMRMSRQQTLTATEVVNSYSEEELANVFHQYGEIRNSRALAHQLCESRRQARIETTHSLRNIASPLANEMLPKYLAKLFQALRIEVNDELGALREMLSATAEVLKPGGRLVVMSYHSLEDRLVKNFMKHGSFQDEPEKDIYGRFQAPLQMLNRKPIVAGEEEQKKNPRSRSARLRIAMKKSEEEYNLKRTQ